MPGEIDGDDFGSTTGGGEGDSARAGGEVEQSLAGLDPECRQGVDAEREGQRLSEAGIGFRGRVPLLRSHLEIARRHTEALPAGSEVYSSDFGESSNRLLSVCRMMRWCAIRERLNNGDARSSCCIWAGSQRGSSSHGFTVTRPFPSIHFALAAVYSPAG